MVKLSTFGAFALLSHAGRSLAQQTVKIMPFGASIVSKCWRANLQTKLKEHGVTNYEFIGSLSSNCPGTGIDQDHEGHSGSLAIDYAKNGNLTGWLNKNSPDVIIMILGTNDELVGKRKPDEVIAAYDILISQMRTKNPKMQIVFSLLPPVDPKRFATAAAGINALNSAIRTWAPNKSTATSQLYLVDLSNAFDPVADTKDGVHPEASGNEKIASKFIWVTMSAISAANGDADQGKLKKSKLDNEFSIVVQDFLKNAGKK